MSKTTTKLTFFNTLLHRCICVCMCVTLCMCNLNAQNPEQTDKEVSTSLPTTINNSNSTFGFKVALNYTIKNGSYITPTVGFSYEWVPKWAGIEIGAYYTNYVYDFNGIHALTHHIKVPILWKIHTKHVNIALGLQTMWYVGYNINENKSAPNFETVKQENYDRYHSYIADPMALDVGAALKIGFPISLSEHWSMEPQLGVEYMYEQSFSATVGLVFRINK